MVQAFLDWRLAVVDTSHLVTYAYALAAWRGCQYYDALYLALAESTGTRLVHADQALHRTLDGRFSFELWIEHYQPAVR